MKQTIATLLAEQATAQPCDANPDVQDFAQQILTHVESVYNLAVWISQDTGEAETLSQETYLRALHSSYHPRSGTNCKVWLLSILRRNHLRRTQRKRQGPKMVDWEKIKQTEEVRREQGETAEEFFSQLTNHEIAMVLKKLPEEYRTAIVLVDIEKLSYEEATEVMECSVGAIRSRLSRGRRMLQGALRSYVLEKDRERDRNTVSPLLKVW